MLYPNIFSPSRTITPKNNDCPIDSECAYLANSCLSCKYNVNGYAVYRKKEYDTRFIFCGYLDCSDASQPNSIIIHCFSSNS